MTFYYAMSYRQELFKILTVITILAVVDFVVTYIVKLLVDIIPQIAIYQEGINTAIHVIIIAVGGYFVIRFLQQILSFSLYNRLEKNVAGTVKFVFDVAFYTVLILAILAVLHVNLTGVLVGGAVGGVVIGLAVQTVAQNLLFGVLVTTESLTL